MKEPVLVAMNVRCDAVERDQKFHRHSHVFMRVQEPDGSLSDYCTRVPWQVDDTGHEHAQQWQHFLRRRKQWLT